MLPPLPKDKGACSHQVNPAEDDSHHKTRSCFLYLLDLSSPLLHGKIEIRKSLAYQSPKDTEQIAASPPLPPFSSAARHLPAGGSSPTQFFPSLRAHPSSAGYIPILWDAPSQTKLGGGPADTFSCIKCLIKQKTCHIFSGEDSEGLGTGVRSFTASPGAHLQPWRSSCRHHHHCSPAAPY